MHLYYCCKLFYANIHEIIEQWEFIESCGQIMSWFRNGEIWNIWKLILSSHRWAQSSTRYFLDYSLHKEHINRVLTIITVNNWTQLTIIMKEMRLRSQEYLHWYESCSEMLMTPKEFWLCKTVFNSLVAVLSVIQDYIYSTIFSSVHEWSISIKCIIAKYSSTRH